MGGDDLDDYTMWMKPVSGGGGGDDDDDDSDVDIIDEHHHVDNNENPTVSKKRHQVVDESSNIDPSEVTTGTTSKKRKKTKKMNDSSSNSSNDNNPLQLLLQVGRTIDERSSTEQAKYLTTAIRHYSLLMNKNSNNSTITGSTDISILPHHCLDRVSMGKPTTTTSTTEVEWTSCIRQIISMKTLREWKHIGSPCIVVICVSARRAVSLLKNEMSGLKLRTGKFFPKNGSIFDQQQQLVSLSLPIVIGTPHRLRQLSTTTNCGSISTSSDHENAVNDDTKKGIHHGTHNDQKNKKNTNRTNEGGSSGGILNWDYTQLVILDNYEIPQKQYTVCTLPDTASDCMNLLGEFVLPQLQQPQLQKQQQQQRKPRKKNCQIVFLK